MSKENKNFVVGLIWNINFTSKNETKYQIQLMRINFLGGAISFRLLYAGIWNFIKFRTFMAPNRCDILATTQFFFLILICSIEYSKHSHIMSSLSYYGPVTICSSLIEEIDIPSIMNMRHSWYATQLILK